jgi:hypothetical protein
LTGASLCALAYYSNADAADLSGSCCADLEERIAELEATTARKGTKKVSLSVYGQLSEGLLFWDADDNNDVAVQSNGTEPSYVGFSGQAKIDANWKAGFVIEIGTGGYEYGVGLGLDTHEIYTRTAALYLDGPVGKVTLGQYAQATDAIAEITTANTAVAARMLSLRPLTGPEIGEVADLFDGTRGNLVRYDTPIMGGFWVSASWASGADDADVWDVALRYAGEFAGFRLAAGVGYRDGLIIPGTGILGMTDEVNVLSGSASVMHVASGIFVSGAAGQLEVNGIDAELKGYHGQAGLEQRFFSLGKTTLFVEAAKAEIDGVDEELELLGAGIVQSIDAAALDVFLNARQLKVDDEDALVGMLGARIKF